MWLAVGAILLGFVGLVWSADRFVAGAASIAESMGMPPIMIGITIVALGTSAPEILVSVDAAMSNAADMAVGNAVGSNIANIGMVLTITALLVPIPISPKVLHREVPFFLFAAVLGAYCLQDFHLSRTDGVLLLIALVVVFYRLIYRKSHEEHPEEETDLEDLPHMEPKQAWMWFFIGLVLLIASADILVWGAKDIAEALGVSQLMIGLTIIAVGTSLPELAASVASALKGHHEIALGNILGSNMLNILAVLSAPALIAAPMLDTPVFTRDYAAMTFITLLLTIMIYTAIKRHGDAAKLGRKSALILLLVYGLYYYQLYIQNVPHA